MPLVGFYLQPAVGGIELSARFWYRFAELDNVVAIKVAPFNRYRTLDVVKGVVAARAEERVTLYTGNDDHIVGDLVTPFVVKRDDNEVTVRIKGGLLGHWSVWTRSAVALLERLRAAAALRPSSRRCSRSTRKSPTRMARSSMRRTGSGAASPAATRCCGGRVCLPEPGAWTRKRDCRPDRPRRSNGS